MALWRPGERSTQRLLGLFGQVPRQKVGGILRGLAARRRAGFQIAGQPQTRIDVVELERGEAREEPRGQLAAPQGPRTVIVLPPYHRPALNPLAPARLGKNRSADSAFAGSPADGRGPRSQSSGCLPSRGTPPTAGGTAGNSTGRREGPPGSPWPAGASGLGGHDPCYRAVAPAVDYGQASRVRPVTAPRSPSPSCGRTTAAAVGGHQPFIQRSAGPARQSGRWQQPPAYRPSPGERFKLQDHSCIGSHVADTTNPAADRVTSMSPSLTEGNQDGRTEPLRMRFANPLI